MYIVDSHCHLDRVDLSEADNKLENILLNASDKFVKYFLCVCIDLENFSQVFDIAKQYPNISASVGVHPTEQNGEEPTLEKLITLANHEKIIAIGETGLDYFHCKGDVTWQQERFRVHIEAAKKIQKPLIIHTRDAREDTIQIMRDSQADQARGVMHCFTETIEMARQALDLGFYISFSGIVTFKSAKELQEVAKFVPLDRILIETDSPYLAPVPHRGKSNQPAYTYYVAEKIAELRNISIEQVAEATTNNFFELFNTAQI